MTKQRSGDPQPGAFAQNNTSDLEGSRQTPQDVARLTDQELDQFVRRTDRAVRLALRVLPPSAPLDRARHAVAVARIEQRRRRAAAALGEVGRLTDEGATA